MAHLNQRDYRFVYSGAENRHRSPGSEGGLFSVTHTVDHGDEDPVFAATNQIVVSRLSLPRKNIFGHAVVEMRNLYGLHFFTVTTVPRPGAEIISNSSIRRRTPGNPSPRLPEVENPSRMAREISPMPGPVSEAMTEIPWQLTAWTGARVIWPLRA